MNKKTKTILGITGFIAFIAIAAFAYNRLSAAVSPETPEAASNNSGNTSKVETDAQLQKAPDFTVFDKDGNEIKLSQLFGKPIVLNFWASWCPPCKSEMPYFDKLYEEMGNDVTFAMIDMVDGQRETTEIGAAYVKDQEFSFPVYFDSTQEAAAVYGISSLPTTLFIDPDGNLVTGVKGAIDEATLRKGIDQIKPDIN